MESSISAAEIFYIKSYTFSFILSDYTYYIHYKILNDLKKMPGKRDKHSYYLYELEIIFALEESIFRKACY